MARIEQIEQMVLDYCNMRSIEVEARESKENIGNMLKDAMRELSLSEYHADKATVRFKAQIQHSVDSKMLKRLYPEIFAELLTEREIMVLRIA